MEESSDFESSDERGLSTASRTASSFPWAAAMKGLPKTNSSVNARTMFGVYCAASEVAIRHVYETAESGMNGQLRKTG